MGRTDEYLYQREVAYIYTEKEQKYGHTITKVQWSQEYNWGLATPHTTKNKDEA